MHRDGKLRNETERNGTFRDGPEIRKSLQHNAFPVLSRKPRERRGEMGSYGNPPHSALRTSHSALRPRLFGCQALRRRTPEARPLHPYRARKPLRAQTCCHRGAPCRNSWPGRRPKTSFSPDFAGGDGCHLRAQTCCHHSLAGMHGMQGICFRCEGPCPGEAPAKPDAASWPKPTDSYRWVWPVAPPIMQYQTKAPDAPLFP